MGKNVFAQGSNGYVKSTSSTNVPLWSSTGLAYSNGVPVNYAESVQSTNNPTLKAYGASLIYQSGGVNSSAFECHMDAPVPGVNKYISVVSAGNTTGHLNINLSSDASVLADSSTSCQYIAFNPAVSAEGVTLTGVTTALWMMSAQNSTVGVILSTARTS